MAARTYDPRQVSVIVGGKTIQGYAPDTYITLERNEDMWALTVGCDGTAARAKSNNRSGRLTLTLLQTSPSNDDLNAIYAADELANSGVVPFLVRDALGRTQGAALTSWCTKLPAIELGGGISMRTWIFETDVMTAVVGGN